MTLTPAAGDRFGWSMANLGDFNGNGSSDLAVGADKDDDGAVWVLFLHDSAFTDIGDALAGTHGDPLFVGDGEMIPGQTVTLSLSNALENANTFFIASAAAINAPFKGGVLVPNPAPPGFYLPLPTGPAGDAAVLSTVWPFGVPSGVPLYFQHWLPNPAGPKGFTASNALEALTP